MVEAQYGAQPASISQQELNNLRVEVWELAETRVTEYSHGGARQYRADYYFKRVN